MPADSLLLSAFLAEALGTRADKSIKNWMNGLRLWHLFNDAKWNGNDGWLPPLKKACERAGKGFQRPPRDPISDKHMRAIKASLDLTSCFGAAVWASATACYSGCRRMGELLVKSETILSAQKDTCRDTVITYSVARGLKVVDIHLVWTKTTTIRGGQCILTQTIGQDVDLCPIWAFENHIAVNHSPPPNTPLFAYRELYSWRPLSKAHFQRVTCDFLLTAGLKLLFGHSYRIGGAVKLLLAGVSPEVVMKLGGWSSLCFLIYWRRLEQLIPTQIADTWARPIQDFAAAHGHPLDATSIIPEDQDEE